MAGENGKILKTYDGGLSWHNSGIVDTTADFNRLFLGISVNAYGYGWLVGDNGKIYLSTDYGSEWVIKESGTTENLYDVVFKNELEGVVVGANGVVRYTSDGGFTWHEDTYLSGITSRDIICITGVDPNTASAVTRNNNFQDAAGTDSTALYTVSSEPLVGLEEDYNTTPVKFKLLQNYPNPFNPSTKIRYTIPNAILAEGNNLNIKLILYDALGNEIATLVDEYKAAGSYEVDFNQPNISSGVYFYKLSAGSFSETKKMILIK